MKLKILLCMCAIAIIPISDQLYITAKPPFLKHNANSCWNDSVIWLLYNIPELVDKLIEDKESYKEGTDLRNLTNLLEAMKNRELGGDKNKDDIKKLDKTIEDAQKTFHKNTACPLTKEQYGDFGDAGALFRAIVSTIPFSQNIISYYCKPSFAKSSEHKLISKKYKKKFKNIKRNSPEKYLYLFYFFNALDENKKIKTILTFIEVDDADKSTGNTYSYEFIGMIIGGTGHATAYIKDQREKGNSWYYCNDRGGSIKKANMKDIPLSLDWSTIDLAKNDYPLLLLYKKLPTTKDIDTFAQALKNIATT